MGQTERRDLLGQGERGTVASGKDGTIVVDRSFSLRQNVGGLCRAEKAAGLADSLELRQDPTANDHTWRHRTGGRGANGP